MMAMNTLSASKSRRLIGRTAAVALSTVALSTAATLSATAWSLSPVWAAPAGAAPAGEASTETNDPALRNLRARLFKAETDVVGLEKQIERFPIFSLQGKLQSGDAKAIWIRGTAFASGGNHPFGVLNEESLFLVQAPYPEHLNNGYFRGSYAFVEARLAGKRAIVAKQVQEKAQVEKERREEAARIQGVKQEAAERQRKAEVTARVTQFLARQEGRGAQVANDPDLLARLIDETVVFEKQIALKDDFSTLREQIVAQRTLLSTLQARKGDLASAVKNAARALWSEEPTEELDFARQSFGSAATKVYTRQPQLLGQLLKAVAQALPDYMKTAEYAEALKARKFSEVLLRCAQGFPVPEKEMLRVAWKSAAGQEAPPVNAVGTGVGAGVGTAVGAAGTLAPPTPTAPVQATIKPVDFSFNVLGVEETKTHKLSDWTGRGVFVLFFNANDPEDKAISPTPMEQLTSIAKQYDPKKVLFLLMLNEGSVPRGDLARWYNDRTDPEANRRMDSVSRVPLRSYSPEAAFFGFNLKKVGAQDTVDWRRSMEKLYFSGRFQDQSSRITVVDLKGDVAGQIDFRASDNTDDAKGNPRQKYTHKIDKDALDALIVRALSPQK